MVAPPFQRSLLAVLATALAGCTSPAPVQPAAVETPPTLAALLPDLAQHVIVPTYVALDEKAATLAFAVDALKQSPSAATLAAARQAWREARAPWELSESHLLGPAKDQELDPALDSWPVNRADLEQVLASGVTLDQAFITQQQPTLKGFHVIEYVLFAHEADGLDARKLAYLTALTADFKATTAKLRQAWEPTGENYAAQFGAPGPGKAFESAEAAFDETLAAMAEICEEVAAGKIEKPLAAKDGTLEESHFSQNTLEDFTLNLKGVQQMYLGRAGDRQGLGLTHLVAAKDPALDAHVRGLIAQALADLAAVPGTFGEAITRHPEALRKAQASIKAVGAALATDVSRALTGKVSADAT